ncbi:c-type cytochrome [Dyella sp. KRB-257]|uniref:c-type cytochrome n=1 Tax=Dyella sp. KRB-257 TaxID=3400915 RepID=UPI003BFAAF5F
MHALWRACLGAAFGLLCSSVTGCHSDQDYEHAATRTPRAATGPVPGPGRADDRSSRARPGPYSGDSVGVEEGRKLFVRYNCSGCHGGHAGGGMGPSLRDQDWIYGSSDDDVFDSIVQGRAHGMPAWGSRITDDQVWMLVAYIRALRTPQEPDAPVSHAPDVPER